MSSFQQQQQITKHTKKQETMAHLNKTNKLTETMPEKSLMTTLPENPYNKCFKDAYSKMWRKSRK